MIWEHHIKHISADTMENGLLPNRIVRLAKTSNMNANAGMSLTALSHTLTGTIFLRL